MALGLIVMALPHPTLLSLIIGAVLTGLGYGVMQPIIYDKAATNAPPRLSTLALSIVMAVNYLAILLAPLILDLTNMLFHRSSPMHAFFVNGLVTLIVAIIALFTFRRSRVLGSDD
jgi:MFS family permease